VLFKYPLQIARN